jgi:hypothetical protein
MEMNTLNREHRHSSSGAGLQTFVLLTTFSFPIRWSNLLGVYKTGFSKRPFRSPAVSPASKTSSIKGETELLVA